MGKRHDKKTKVNFKIYDVTNWETSNCNTHIDQYFKKQRQSDHKICSVIRIEREEVFPSKIIQKIRQGD